MIWTVASKLRDSRKAFLEMNYSGIAMVLAGMLAFLVVTFTNGCSLQASES